MKYITVLLVVCLAGCLANQGLVDISSQINVFGIKPYSDIDYLEINGVKATEEPCLRGYERDFGQLYIIVGYGFNKKIRKINTRNPKTSMFGITPGMSTEEAKKLALQVGLTEIAPGKYQAANINMLLLSDDKGKVFGMTVEISDY